MSSVHALPSSIGGDKAKQQTLYKLEDEIGRGPDSVGNIFLSFWLDVLDGAVSLTP